MGTYTGAVTKAKTVVAAVGATVTALAVALPVFSEALSDENVSAGEIGTLVTTVVALAATVYGVWRVPNRPVETGRTGSI